MVIGFGQEADTALQVDRTHTLQFAPKGHAAPRRLGRYLIGQQQPGLDEHTAHCNVTMVTLQMTFRHRRLDGPQVFRTCIGPA